MIVLDVLMDDVDHVLALDDSSDFTDLHLLWDRLDGLPTEIVLALVEKECGDTLQEIEDLFSRQLKVKGVSSASTDGLCGYRLSNGYRFLSDISPWEVYDAGRADRLDASAVEFAELHRPAVVEAASVGLEEPRIGALAVGDRLVCEPRPEWRERLPDDDLIHIVAGIPESESLLSFAQLVSRAYPEVPAATGYVLVRHGRKLAEGVFDRIGDKQCFRLIRMY